MSEKGYHQHKVRFIQNEESNAITVDKQLEPENSFLVHLGFLKINHHYKIEFSIPKSQFLSAQALQSNLTKVNNSPHCQLVHLVENPLETKFYVELYAHTECALTEKISSPHIELTFVAQVLGENKGTPLLKDGIHIIHNSSLNSHPPPSDQDDSEDSS